ncbi:hypothetical protein BV22DRAFT_1042060 [Leucogyrophana mollusca]|uniref:Uncharacterized protein n=1 Tax=Leucogyrophana mollusca TaxID=85980 RepID=A0ACB8AZV1_9AGAM|nr:hypothetical protein BV22DRAFT_1042060 [Leucogyrophana mollusca]
MSSITPIEIPLGPMCGALYLASLLSVGLWGITCMQTFMYYVHYQEDKMVFKFFVAYLWVFDTTHQSLIIGGVYKILVVWFDNPLFLTNVVQELIWGYLISTFVALPTQGFFVYRIWRFTNKSFIPPLLWFPSAIYQLVSCLIYVSKGTQSTTTAALGVGLFKTLVISCCVVAVATDTSIAIGLTYLLLKRDIGSGFKRSARMLQRLAIFSINSGSWTAIFALLMIILYTVFPSNLIYVVGYFPVSSIYCNTLLANLNARAYIRGESSSLSAGADLISMQFSTTKVNRTPAILIAKGRGRSKETSVGALDYSRAEDDVEIKPEHV